MKTVLITGANRGIGLEHVRAFVARGIKVLAAVRSPDDADDLKAVAVSKPGLVEILRYDAADSLAPVALTEALGDTPIDLLFANAGAMGSDQTFGSVDVAAALELMRINALAPLKLVEALVANVARSDRKLVAFQSSLMGSIGDNSSGGYYAYRTSKAMLNMIAKSLANDLRSRAITVVSLHPGWVKTRMGGQNAPVTIEQCVSGQQKIFTELSLSDSGRFFNYDGKALIW